MMSSFGERLKKSRIKKGITQKELSQKLGVAQSTIANYENNIRFPGNEILKEISEYLKISLDFLLGIDLNESKEKYDFILENDELVDDFVNYLIIGDSNNAKQLIKNAHTQGIDLLRIITQIFIPALRKIGDLWERNQISIAQEHYSSALIEKLLDYLSEVEPVKEEKVYKALFMVPGGEEHTLSLKMAAEFFRRKGWGIIYIGRSIPLDSLIGVIRERKPDLIVLSILTPGGTNSCSYMVQALKLELSSRTPLILIGGRGIENEREALNIVGADMYLPSIDNLKEKINEIEERL